MGEPRAGAAHIERICVRRLSLASERVHFRNDVGGDGAYKFGVIFAKTNDVRTILGAF